MTRREVENWVDNLSDKQFFTLYNYMQKNSNQYGYYAGNGIVYNMRSANKVLSGYSPIQLLSNAGHFYTTDKYFYIDKKSHLIYSFSSVDDKFYPVGDDEYEALVDCVFDCLSSGTIESISDLERSIDIK